MAARFCLSKLFRVGAVSTRPVPSPIHPAASAGRQAVAGVILRKLGAGSERYSPAER